MKVSAKAEYACLAMLDLALKRDRPEPVRLVDIAARNDIPERFLVQILLQLKGAGLVHSVRGASGGYHLAVAPETVTVWDVIQLIDGSNNGSSAADVAHKGVGWQLLLGLWHEANASEQALLQKVTFARLAEQASQQNANMFYI